MKFIVVGAGLIGDERIKALNQLSRDHGKDISIQAVIDPDQARLETYKNAGISTSQTLDEKLIAGANWAIVATPHDQSADIVSKCFSLGMHVIAEKPLGRTFDEASKIVKSKPADLHLYVGHNYRFFKGVSALIADMKSGKFGDLISVNMTLGHGNSPGMEKSWKLDPIKCGGGALIDPGVHLLDLANYLSKDELKVEAAKAWQGFWNTGIEEECHLILSAASGCLFNIQVSLNRWRSQFRIEVNGTEAYGVVEGRGRSYGQQTYKIGPRWGWLNAPSQAASEQQLVGDYDASDSFLNELKWIAENSHREPRGLGEEPFSVTACTSAEASRTMELLESIRSVMTMNTIHK